MLLFIVLATVIAVGITAIALAQPERRPYAVVWNDEAERQMLREGKVRTGWW